MSQAEAVEARLRVRESKGKGKVQEVKTRRILI
jgi:hypothetical protein